MKKRVLTLTLAVLLALSLAVPAFAANPMQFKVDYYGTEQVIAEFSDVIRTTKGEDYYEQITVYHLPANATVTFHIPDGSDWWELFRCNGMMVKVGRNPSWGLENDTAYTCDQLNAAIKANMEWYEPTNEFFCEIMEMWEMTTGARLFKFVFDGVEIKKPAEPTAVESTQTVKVDGKAVDLYAYALVNEQGGITNYVKLRDVAALLSGTKGQFEVGWNGSINLETGKPYTKVGGELEKTFQGDQPYVLGDAPVNVNGSPVDLKAITLMDANGGNYNYFELRKLGEVLGFNVGWSKADGVFIETDKPYDPNN